MQAPAQAGKRICEHQNYPVQGKSLEAGKCHLGNIWTVGCGLRLHQRQGHAQMCKGLPRMPEGSKMFFPQCVGQKSKVTLIFLAQVHTSIICFPQAHTAPVTGIRCHSKTRL